MNLFQKIKRIEKVACYWIFCIKFANLWFVVNEAIEPILITHTRI